MRLRFQVQVHPEDLGGSPSFSIVAVMRTLLALVLVCVLVGCWDDDGPIDAVSYGEHLFSDPDFSRGPTNVFACSTCHSVRPEPSVGGPRIAYSLYNSAFRESWWGGYAPRLIDAVSNCNTYFMFGDRLDPEDARARALYEYLIQISPERPSAALPLTVVENITILPRGNPALGEQVYASVCSVCHGATHTGDDRLADWLPVLPEATLDAGHHDVEPALVVIEKVRHGQFFGIGGYMPLFSREALSDEELSALLAYFEL